MTDSERDATLVQFVKEHLSPTQDERTLVSQRYHQLQGYLSDRTFQHGSYARYTSTTPVNDLDALYIVPEEVRKGRAAVDPSRLDLNDIVNSLAAELRQCYGSSARIEAEPPAVSIYFGQNSDFSIDVVPVLPADSEMFWVPDVAHMSIAKRREAYRASASRTRANWVKSDPRGYIAQATTLDDATNGRFRKTVKALKKWRWSSSKAADSFPLRSFHLELAVTRIVQERPGASCLDRITRSIECLPSLLTAYQYPDRANPVSYVDGYVARLNDADRRTLAAEFDAARQQWHAVLEAASNEDLRNVLSDFFGVASGTLATLPSPKLPVLRGMLPAQGREGDERFLQDLGIPIALQFRLRIDARVQQRGYREFKLRERGYPLRKGADLDFYVKSCTVPSPFSVKWKIKNTGAEAAAIGQLRGEIVDDDGRQQRHEQTRFWGSHYVECYAIREGVCVAADRIEVPIGNA